MALYYPYVDPDTSGGGEGGGGGSLTANDTSSLDLTYFGGALSGTVKISAANGNALTLNPDGLYVATGSSGGGGGSPGTETFITVTDTATLDLSASGLSNHTISGSVKVSAQANNALTALSDGLYVNGAGGGGGYGGTGVTAVSDSTTIDHTLASGTLTSAVKVSSNAGNALQSLSTGLYVPSADIATLAVADTSTLDLTFNSGTNTISGVAKVSSDPQNLLTIASDGLLALPPTENLGRFLAYRSSGSQAFTGYTKALFNAEAVDNLNGFDTTTSKFTCPDTGTWMIGGSLYGVGGSTVSAGFYLYLNGVLARVYDGKQGGPYGVVLNGLSMIELNEGDELELWAIFTPDLVVSYYQGANYFYGWQLSSSSS